jgi:TPR repeat protein
MILVLSKIRAVTDMLHGSYSAKQKLHWFCLVSSWVLVLSLSVQGQIIAQQPFPPSSASFARDLSTAQQGNSDAQLRVGKAYNEGTGVRQNFAEAMKWFDAASRQGSKEATAWLGNAYLSGQGVPQDVERGIALIQSAATADDPVGHRLLGVAYQNGTGVPRDYSKAMEQFSQAARQKDAPSYDLAGMMFLRGVGVAHDLSRAKQLFGKGARLGDSWAQLHLGEMFESGNFPAPPPKGSKKPSMLSGTLGSPTLAPQVKPSKPVGKPNFNLAMKLFTMSASQGNRVAAFKLGEMHETGRGTAQDFTKAIQFYRQSAAKQFAPAQLALGRITEMGQGTPVNLNFAYLWYSLAAGQESTEAQRRLDSLIRKMTPAQLEEVQGLLVRLETNLNGN